MDNKKNGIPKLRFPGFTGAWEQRKLGKVVELYGGNAFSSKDSTTDGIPWLKISNVSTNGIDWETKSFLPTNYWKKYPEYQLKKGDYVMALTRPVLNHALKIGKVDRPSLLNQRVAKLKFKFNREFTFQLLRRQQVVLRIENELAGTDPPNLGSRNLMQVNITLPINIHEQQKIGEYFSKFDSLIALHQRKLEHLQEQKKGLLQKMFPKNGENVPEVRFPGFTDAWEQRKLGEVATFINGRAYKQNELLDSGKYKVLRVGNFYTNDSWYYSNLELADKYYIDEGDLVYTWSATFGPHIWNGKKVIYHYHIWKIELSKFLDRDFTLQILEADKAKLLANTNGSTMIHVTKKDMESKVISLPSIEEQKKIGSYLMKFDSLITLHQRKLDHLELMKKGLLQQMFV